MMEVVVKLGILKLLEMHEVGAVKVFPMYNFIILKLFKEPY